MLQNKLVWEQGSRWIDAKVNEKVPFSCCSAVCNSSTAFVLLSSLHQLYLWEYVLFVSLRSAVWGECDLYTLFLILHISCPLWFYVHHLFRYHYLLEFWFTSQQLRDCLDNSISVPLLKADSMSGRQFLFLLYVLLASLSSFSCFVPVKCMSLFSKILICSFLRGESGHDGPCVVPCGPRRRPHVWVPVHDVLLSAREASGKSTAAERPGVVCGAQERVHSLRQVRTTWAPTNNTFNG